MTAVCRFKLVVGGPVHAATKRRSTNTSVIPAFLVNMANNDQQQWDEGTGKVELDWFIADDVLSYVNSVARL